MTMEGQNVHELLAHMQAQYNEQIAGLQQQLQQTQQAFVAMQNEAHAAPVTVRNEVSRNTAKVPKPSRFDGSLKQSQHLKEWLKDCENWMRLSHVPDVEYVAFFRTLLEDTASQWLHGRPELDDAPWSEFKTAFVQRFHQKNQENVARGRISSITQGGRDVRSFIAEFAKLEQQLPKMDGGDKRYQFLRGLHPSVRDSVTAQNPVTWHEAADIAVSLSDGRIHTSTPNYHHQRVNIPRSDPMVLGTMQAGNTRHPKSRAHGKRQSLGEATAPKHRSEWFNAPSRCSALKEASVVRVDDPTVDPAPSKGIQPITHELELMKDRERCLVVHEGATYVEPESNKKILTPVDAQRADSCVEGVGSLKNEQDEIFLSLASMPLQSPTNMFIYEGLVGSIQAQFMIDTGAELNAISAAFVQQHGLTITPLSDHDTATEVKLPDGTCLQAIGKLAAKTITIGRYTDDACDLDIFVLELRGFDVILGMPWINKYSVQLDGRERTATLTLKGEQVELHPEASRCERRSELRSVRCMAKLALKKALYLAVVTIVNSKETRGNDDPDTSARNSCPEREQILKDFADVITDDLPPGLPPEQRVKHCIKLEPGSQPVNKRPIRFSEAENQELVKHLQDLLDKGFIKPSDSPYGAPVLFAKKPGGGLRLCIDYRALNQQTIKNVFPLPRIDELLDQLQGATIYSKLDLASGYHQIRMDEESIERTAFNTRYGHYEFTVMPFGLCNAPATFQTLMNDLFRPYLGKFVVVYLDDILVFSKSVAQHEEHLRLVLGILQKAKLIAKRKKCELFSTDTIFLGHRLTADGIQPDPSKVSAVKNWPTPANKKELFSFLGLAGWNRKFIQNFASITAPLTDLLSPDTPFLWEEKENEAFLALKKALISEPVLKLPDPSRPYVVYTDASKLGVGCVLLQDFGRGLQPVSYESHKLSNHEKNYPTHDRELLSIMHALKKWRHYLYGAEMSVRNDHRSLQYFINQPKLNDRQTRWLATLADFNLKIEYVKGVANVVADALSRHPLHLNSLHVAHYGVDLLREIQHGYRSDEFCTELIEKLKSDQAPGFELLDGYLYKITRKGSIRLVVPRTDSVLQRLLCESHDSTVAGHLGRDKTLQRLQQSYYWLGMADDVAKYVNTCLKCQMNKASNKKPIGLLQPLPIPTEPWENVSLDFIVQLPKTKTGFDAIAVFVDKLTKFAHFVPMHTTDTAVDVARLFFDTIFRHHGLPTGIISDRDPRFISEFWKALWKLLGTKLMMSTAYHPQTDGQTERMNRVLEEYLRSFVNHKHDDWDYYLTAAEFAYNSSVHAGHHHTPFFLNSGRNPRTPLDVVGTGPESLSKKTKQDNATTFLIGLRQALTDCRANLLVAQQRQKKYADKRRREVVFKVGDSVLVDKDHFRLPGDGPSHKLTAEQFGPFKILELVGTNAIRLDLPETLHHWPVVNVSRCEPLQTTDRFQDRPAYQPNPGPVMDIEGSPAFTVERFMKVRYRRGRPPVSGERPKEYLVRWAGYGAQHDMWRPEVDLRNDLTDEIFEELVSQM